MARYERSDPTTEWLAYIQDGSDGLVLGANVLREQGLEPTRQGAEETELARAALALDPDAPVQDDVYFVLADPWPFFRDVLRWPDSRVAGVAGGPNLPGDLTVLVPERDAHIASDWAILNQDGKSQLLVMLRPDLDADGRGQEEHWEATPHQQLDRLVRQTGVEIGVLVARNALRLLYAPNGETTGWMTWPLAALGRSDGRPMLAGLKVALGRERLFVGPPELRLRPLLEASRNAQNEVSEKLSGQVLGALHELLRGLYAADRHRIEQLATDNPHHLYEGILTCLMRLVFLLYAEDRDLLPTSRDGAAQALWQSGYSVKTLFARLEDDTSLHPDTMDERRGAWGQLLAAFRLVHRGYPNWITGRGGKLFDPDAFPFLEGRSAAEPPAVLPVSDGCIYRILEGLMTLPAATRDGARERLSYRTLDVEQIGSVYETVMGFTAASASEQMIAVVDEKGLPSFIGTGSLLAQKPANREKWLGEQSVKLTPKQKAGVKDAANEAALLAALAEGQARAHKVGAIDLRGSPGQHPIPPGAPYLQPTDERRRSGSHYTPRELTHPIVKHALEPAFDRIGSNAAPEDVLSLKVCDPACGSGAFLVEACRQLGDRLVAAWVSHPAERPTIPPDEDEQLHARRLIAQRCLYGVDRNPMAVDLARLSLWLATLAREHEFTFLDHALKAGDSLVGLDTGQLAALHWDRSKPEMSLFRPQVKERIERATRGREAIRTAPDDVTRTVQEARHGRIETEVAGVRDAGDAVVAAFFSEDKPKARETARQEVESWVLGGGAGVWERFAARARAFREAQGWRPFHWPLEFPEVFARDNPGFDAIIGNPPFLGGTNISERLGMPYFSFLTGQYSGARHHCDLVAYFFRKAFSLLRRGGAFGFIATNTISQGDTRRGGLEQIIAQSGHVFRVVRRLQWPGEAAVVVKTVHVSKDASPPPMIESTPVNRISAFLIEGDVDASPHTLAQNEYVSLGCKPYAQGLIFDDGDSDANRIRELELIELESPSERQHVHKYISGEDLNSRSNHDSGRWIIQVSHIESEEQLKRLPRLYEIILEKVKPGRMALGSNPNNIPLKRRWWAYQAHRPQLTAALARLDRAICISRVTPHLAFCMTTAHAIFSEAVVVVASESDGLFAVLQSRAHEVWARYFSSSMKDDLRYAPSDCFETFPFPPVYETDPALEEAGRRYHDHRAELMVAADEGMTRTYNRFHRSTERAAPIATLRDLHDAMDRAVLAAYGWHDLAAPPEQGGVAPRFLTEADEDDHTYQNRLFWPAETRDRVLARLLALNASRAAGDPDPVYSEAGANSTAAAE